MNVLQTINELSCVLVDSHFLQMFTYIYILHGIYLSQIHDLDDFQNFNFYLISEIQWTPFRSAVNWELNILAVYTCGRDQKILFLQHLECYHFILSLYTCWNVLISSCIFTFGSDSWFCNIYNTAQSFFSFQIVIRTYLTLSRKDLNVIIIKYWQWVSSWFCSAE